MLEIDAARQDVLAHPARSRARAGCEHEHQGRSLRSSGVKIDEPTAIGPTRESRRTVVFNGVLVEVVRNLVAHGLHCTGAKSKPEVGHPHRRLAYARYGVRHAG